VDRIPHPGVRVLFVGADLERKGGVILLEAFRRLRAELSTQIGSPGIPVELHLVTRSQIPEEPGIYTYNHMRPNTTALKDLFFESDIFCLPTLGDCLPVALAEAGAAHLPLVSTRVGAIPEIVRDGETGFLIPPGDALALTSALRRLICDVALRRTLGEQAARMAQADHDAGANASRLIELLKDTASENRASRRIL
jgi:glycosyltransferase involved in cell wall biosynthesis